MRRTLLIMLAITTICASCLPGEMGDAARAEESLPAVIQLNVQAEEQPDMLTRAVNSDVINDLHVLVYDNNGELIGQKYQPTGGGTITVKTHKASSCTIYAIANTGDPGFFKGYDKHPEKSLTDRIYTLAAWNELDGRKNIPMTGMKANVNIAAGSQSLGNLEVARMAARVTLNIDVAPHSGITIKDYTLHSLPLKSYYVLRPLSTENNMADTNASPGDDASKAADNNHWADGAVTAVNAASVSTDFYMFENRRGVVTGINLQKDKIAAKAPAHATYVEINGTAGNVAAKWRVYLGTDDPGNFNIKRNCTYTYNITLNDAVTADTRVTLDLTKVTDLSAAGTANCYIASQTSTWYKFKATVRGNGAATAALISPTGSSLAANAPINPTAAELLWEAGQGTYGIKAKDIIQAVLLQNGYIYFKTGHVDEGNAVIAAKDATGTIIWSWHIWKTHFDLNNMPQETYLTATERSIGTYLTNRELIMMDRNLGAANNNMNDAAAFGLYYQFGRKDPFVGPSKIQQTTEWVQTSPINMPKNIVSNSTTGTIEYSIKHPDVHILGDPTPDINNIAYYNWIYGITSTTSTFLSQSNALWGNPFEEASYPNNKDGYKTIYDPCPSGWKVPPQDTWTRMLKPDITPKTNSYYSRTVSEWSIENDKLSDIEIVENFNKLNGIKFKLLKDGGTVYFPASGAIYGTTGQLADTKNRCYFWSSSPYCVEGPSSFWAGGLSLNLSSSSINVGPITTYGRGSAMPIRCVRETSCQRL